MKNGEKLYQNVNSEYFVTDLVQFQFKFQANYCTGVKCLKDHCSQQEWGFKTKIHLFVNRRVINKEKTKNYNLKLPV